MRGGASVRGAVLLLGVALACAAVPAAAAPRARHHFVLVHGAWHGAWCWYRVTALLERAGQTVTVVDLPSHGRDRTPPEDVELADYTVRVVQALDAAGEPVILVGHSMGGIVVSQAAEARPETVAKLVYVAAFLVPSGMSSSQISLQDTESVLNRHLRAADRDADGQPDVLEVDPAAIRESFYGRSPDADVALAASLLTANPLAPLLTPLALGTAWESVPRYYVTTLRDQAISPASQERMYTETPVRRVFRMRTDHSPFFSEPRKLAKILLRIAR